MIRRILCSLTITLAACGRVGSSPVPEPAIWLLSSPVLAADSIIAPLQGGLVVLDTATIRPVLKARGGSESANTIATFTTYQGTRYHPEMIRAITEDSAVVIPFSRAVVTAASGAGKGLLLDAQEMPAEDVPRLIRMLRGLASALRDRGRTPFGVIVPASDTLAYPAEELARAADLVVVRFGDAHRPGTPAGPLATPEVVRRELGIRLNGLGASRLAAEFPLYGYIWNRDSSTRAITFREANAILLQEAGAFRRDPASRYLTASLQNGSTIWVPDAETIRSLIAVTQSRGVNTIALTGINGADPAIIAGVSELRR
ncbi:MAG TPA: hypothetical protein VF042_03380 [Gemmatimonadaceae bacterium]